MTKDRAMVPGSPAAGTIHGWQRARGRDARAVLSAMSVRAAFFGALLVFAATAQGAEPPVDAGTAITQVGDTTAPDWDSIYTAIQRDYEMVVPIVRRGCYNCHSAETRFPWYHKLPLIKGWMNGHIRKARERVDLAPDQLFGARARLADHLLSIRNEVVEGEMPPWYYRIMHWDARPTGASLDSLVGWIDASLQTLAVHGQYPMNRPDLVPGYQEATAK